ncbi:uncharacterized protein EV420DRAFT_1267381 [Desarmillaria tabescens]|uniref:PHD-type domain-containing protein n=1 Tax=Armillaria tabescens TaxID=1929756 RepID=A0AA39N8N5_ARMTA|nr:uncharacterized protein EV420DRAFT_1267381 [Desarmillaria tabescens]KAK0461063.1 hypothetical protein EV420DRAFT_1267381 [Desarmillaria tabescens]
MAPPPSPRETRRSGRRSAQSGSTGSSKSPDSETVPRSKDGSQRPSLSTHNSSSRTKRLKQEEADDAVNERKNGHAGSTSSSSSTQGASNGRSRRKPKDKDKDIPVEDSADTITEEPLQEAGEEEEEQGITRCVCGSTGEDDPDAGEFMVQCETCKVWQHGLCMGYESEDQLQNDDYYCELCRPDLHADLLKKKPRKVRQSSTASHHTVVGNRLSRSRSPSHTLKQQSKRRNTMNSRDAAFDENLKEILETTAAEADAVYDTKSIHSNTNEDEEVDVGTTNRRKRKRKEDDAPPNKRTRSTSIVSDRRAASVIARDETPIQSAPVKTPALSAPQPKARGKRGGRKAAAHTELVVNENGEGMISSRLPKTIRYSSVTTVVAPPAKRQGGGGRGKGAHARKIQNASTAPASAAHDGRRNQANGPNGAGGPSAAGEGSRAYRNSHAYVVSQQPLLTSWGLPDYLAHLEEIFPTPTPTPLDVPSSGDNGIEINQERGVKTKWPGKRMSVGDMNKRVRTLVEWVGREQASAQDRMRRRDALEKALKEVQAVEENVQIRDEPVKDDASMFLDGQPRTESPLQQRPNSATPQVPILGSKASSIFFSSSSSDTMKQMEGLMEELIRFQERFGRGRH